MNFREWMEQRHGSFFESKTKKPVSEGPLSFSLGVGINGTLGVAGALLGAVLGAGWGAATGVGGVVSKDDPKRRDWSGRENGPFGALVGMAINSVKKAWQMGKEGWDAGTNAWPMETIDAEMLMSALERLVNALKPYLGMGESGLKPGAEKVAEILRDVPPEQHQTVVMQAANRLGVKLPGGG